MTNEEQKLREFISKYVNDDNEPTFLSDLTALISEGYVEKAKYDEAVRQRDELREALERIANPIAYMERNLKEDERLNGMMAIQISNNAEYLKGIADAAIKNTEG